LCVCQLVRAQQIELSLLFECFQVVWIRFVRPNLTGIFAVDGVTAFMQPKDLGTSSRFTIYGGRGFRYASQSSWGMQKRRLGRTGLQVSRIGFGGIPIIALSRREAESVVTYAFQQGITYFDTARAYGDSEEKIGAALKGVRDDVVIATKVPWQRTKADAANVGLKQSLRNLQTDRIDSVQLHGIDSEELLSKVTAPDGSLAALKKAKSEGKVDYVGITGHNPHVLEKAVRTREFDTVLVPLNVLDRRATETLFSVAKELDVGTIAMKTMGGCAHPLEYPQREARFLGKPKDWPDSSEFIFHFGKEGIERAQRSLRFVLAHDIDAMIPGFRSTEEVDDVLKIADGFHGLDLDEKKAYKFGELPPEPFCRQCEMCMPCPEGVEIPTILKWSTYHTFYEIKKWTRDQYPKLRTRTNSCTECGECEKNCPYHLPVIKMLHEAEKILT
jgi:predicted aldo/keto reductase-like oxidoreductase